MDWRVRCGGGAAMVADNRVVTRASAIIPLLNRNTATLPIWRGFLGTFRPQHRFFCCGLKWLRNARGFDVVAVLRFVYPLGAQIALKGPGELIQIVAFRRPFPDPDRLRVDFELRKQLGDLVRADRLAVASPLRPRPALYPVQGLRKLGRCQPIGFLIGGHSLDVAQQYDADGAGFTRRQLTGSRHQTRRPLTPDDIGNGNEGPPVVTATVDQIAHLRILATNGGSIIRSPTGAHARRLDQWLTRLLPQFLQWLVSLAALHLDHDRTLIEIVRHGAIAGKGGSAIDAELAQLQLVAQHPHDRSALAMALVQQRMQIAAVLDILFRFIQQHCWLEYFDRTKQCRR